MDSTADTHNKEDEDTDNTKHTINRSQKVKELLFLKKKQNELHNEIPKHKYFKDHQCRLPSKTENSEKIKYSCLRQHWLQLTTVNMEDIRAKNMFRSYSALCSEKQRQCEHFPCSLHPFSNLRIWFEGLVTVSLMISNVALAVHFSERDPQKTQHYMAMYTFDAIYLINILMNCFTGYVKGTSRKSVILEIRKIVWKYARTWLLIDLVSILCFMPGFIYMEDVFNYLLLISFKILRLPTMMRYLGNVVTVLKVGNFGKTMTEILAIVVTYLTWNIYFQHALEYMKMDSFYPTKPDNCSWITMANIWNTTTSLRFAYTLDRAVAMLRKNSNINILEQKGCFEAFFIVAWLAAKIVVFHCTLKYMVYRFGSESANAKYFIMTIQLQTLMNQKSFPPRIKEKIQKFYAIRFQGHYFSESRILNCVTGQLREDIIMHTVRQLVREVEFLKQLPRSLLLQIGMKLKIVIFIAGDIIFKINTVGDCLYFIDKGTIAIYSESGKEVCHLEDGAYFGEIALVLKNRIRTASAIAVTNCELFRLDKEDFDSSMACYPTVYDTIKKVAMERYEKTSVLDEHYKAELKIAKDHALKRFSDEL